MNYYYLEREVLGYQAEMRRRTERRRALGTDAPAGPRARSLRLAVADALRGLANQFYARAAHLI